MIRVLLIDDEPTIGRAVTHALRPHGISIDAFSEVTDFLEAARSRKHRALLIDWNLRSCEGTELCTTLRVEGDRRPIAIVSGKLEADHARTLAFAAGADGYIEKPSPAAELARQITVLAKKRRSRTSKVYRCMLGAKGRATIIELRRGKIVVHEYVIRPPPREFQLFQYLLEHAGQILLREELAERVWRNRVVPTTTIVQTAISRLREELGSAAGVIETVPGGYRIRTFDADRKVSSRSH